MKNNGQNLNSPILTVSLRDRIIEQFNQLAKKKRVAPKDIRTAGDITHLLVNAAIIQAQNAIPETRAKRRFRVSGAQVEFSGK